MPTCDHNAALGLPGPCPACPLEIAEDSGGWYEYGPHPAGRAALRRLEEEMDEAAAAGEYPGEVAAGDEVPF